MDRPCASPAARPAPRPTAPLVLLLIGILLAVLGIWTGETARILEKAIQVCLQCIGIG